METVSVRCNHCGAPLEVGRQTRFVTCEFCKSHLEVKRTESSIFTEEVERIARNTDQMAESLEVIALQNEIAQLDREWMALHGNGAANDGQQAGPSSTAGGWFGMIFVVFFAVVAFSMAGFGGSVGAPGFFTMVPIGMGILALVVGVMNLVNSQARETAHSDYQLRRSELLRKIGEVRKD